MERKLELALERLEKGASEETVRALALAARVMEARERLEETFSVHFGELSEEAVKRVRSGRSTVLQEAPADLPAAGLAAAAHRILSIVLEEAAGGISEEDFAALKGVCWEALVTPEAARAAGSRPEAFLEAFAAAASAAGFSEDLLSRFLLPAAALAIRVFIGRAAKKAAADLDRNALEERPYPFQSRCPVCGGDPVFARVSETVSNGSVRRLTCGVCGAAWLWKRIGCPACGTIATRELKYFHDESDASHRLYVCSHCGEILPTVFEADGAQASAPDELERVLLADLERACRASAG